MESWDLDGGNRETIANGQADPRGIVVDREFDLLFWVTRGDGSIRTSNLNGSGQAVFLNGLNSPADLAMDRVGRVLYWVEEDAGRIRRKTVDGDETPTDVISGLNDPYYLAVDGGFIYWSEFDNTVIRRCTLDGLNQEVVVSGLFQVRDVEVADGVIYWCDRDSSDVRSRAVDGMESGEVLFSGGGMERPHGLVLDPEEGQLYWTDTRAKRVSSGAMDGSGGETIIVSRVLDGDWVNGPWAIDFWRAPVDVFQEWREENFTSEELADAGLEMSVWGNSADPDGDGRENLMEYAQGTDPKVSGGMLIETAASEGKFQVKVRMRKNDGALQYAVESSPDLSAAVWQTDELMEVLPREVDEDDPSFEYVTVEVPFTDVNGARLFARLRVER